MTGDASLYWDACRRHELVVQACAACGERVHLPAAECPRCGSAGLSFAPVSGEAVVHTFTVVHRAFVPAFRGREPYVLAWVDLREGARAFGRIVDCAPERVRIGMPVRLTFDQDDLPQWRPE